MGPRSSEWARQAIERGGGQAVGIDESPLGLVWTDSRAIDALRATLDSHPGIWWVQLPLAGVERIVAAGVVDCERQWTSAKGAYAEPVAEHALALLLGMSVLSVSYPTWNPWIQPWLWDALDNL